MTEAVPMIASWYGVPLNEMPREDLEREFCKAHETIARLQREASEKSVAYIRDLAQAKRDEIQASRSFLHLVLDRIAS